MTDVEQGADRAANTELVRRHFDEILNRENLDACEELMARNFVEHAAAPFGTDEPGRVDGPSHMRETVAWLTGQFPDMHMAVEAVVADGDLVAARVVSEGTLTGAVPGGPPPTGRRFRSAQSHWFRVVDGQLAEHWATRDDLSAMIQLGLVRPPGPPPG